MSAGADGARPVKSGPPAIEDADLRPPAILSIGITGHRDIELATESALEIERSIERIISRLGVALNEHVTRPFFQAVPALQVMSMGAQGADLLAMRAAERLQVDTTYVLPYGLDQFRKDFESSPYLALFEAHVAAARRRLELPGTPSEGPRSYERANAVIISNADILIAVWNGLRARGVGGTADVVQQAFDRGMPIFAIDPAAPQEPSFLWDDEYINSRKSVVDVVREKCPADFGKLIAAVVNPPVGFLTERLVLPSLSATPIPRSRRPEYRMLLAAFSSSEKSPTRQPIDETSAWQKAQETAGLVDADWARRLAYVQEVAHRFDELASHYGNLYRSSNATAYFAAILASILSGLIGLFYPDAVAETLLVQAIIACLLFFDRWNRSQRLWHEKWLTFRCAAERLKTIRFLQPFGMFPLIQADRRRSAGLSMADWIVHRVSRSIGLPHGCVSGAEIADGITHLRDCEIPAQIAYHRRSYRRFGSLDRNLVLAANCSLVGIVVVSAVPKISTLLGISTPELLAKGPSAVLLSALPAMVAAFGGLRADTDLVRLVERSAWASAYLGKLRRMISGGLHSYDDYADLAQRTALVLAAELIEWQAVLESRRLRLSRRQAFKKRLLPLWIRKYTRMD